jgi:hypothetical protein
VGQVDLYLQAAKGRAIDPALSIEGTMTEPKPTRGGKRAGAGSGGKRPGAGRKRSRLNLPRGTALIMERQTIGGLDPFHPAELWTVLSVSDTELEFQSGDDIIVLRLPDSD